MASPNINMTLGIKAAMKAPKHTFTLTVTTKLTKPYIWMMKLRYIWAVITAKIGSDEVID